MAIDVRLVCHTVSVHEMTSPLEVELEFAPPCRRLAVVISVASTASASHGPIIRSFGDALSMTGTDGTVVAITATNGVAFVATTKITDFGTEVQVVITPV